MKEQVYQKELQDWEQSAKFHQVTLSHPFRQFLWQKVLKTYNISKNEKSILEIGCGVGSFISLLNQKEKGVTGVDFSKNMLEVAKRINPPTTFILASAENLPLKDNSFDIVVTNMVLHHLKAQGIMTQSLKEISRILKPGGIFYVFDHKDNFLSRSLLTLFNFGQRLLFFLKRNVATSGTRSEIMFTKKDIKEIIDKGFKQVRTTDLIAVPYRLLEITSNTAGYLFGPNVGLKTARVLFPLARWAEEKLNLSWLKTEQCLKFKKI